MKLMKHEIQLDMEQPQVLSLLTSTGKQFCCHFSYLQSPDVSNFTLESSGSQSTKCVFFLLHLFARSSSYCSLDPPKASSQHAHYHKTIYPHSVGPGEGFCAFPRWGSSALTWSSNTNSERWDSLKKERWEELNTSYRQWLMRGMYPLPTRTDTDQPDWRHWDPVTVKFFSSIWSSALMNSSQFISGPNWNFLANWVGSEGKGMGAADQDWCLLN